MHPVSRLPRRAALLACASVAIAPMARGGAANGLRALMDESGEAPSELALGLLGRRIAVTGMIGPVPNGTEGWLAIGETALVPCPLCGGAHDWPAGVLAVHAPAAPHLADPYTPVTLEGTLALDRAAAEAVGLPGRLVLRDATVPAA